MRYWGIGTLWCHVWHGWIFHRAILDDQRISVVLCALRFWWPTAFKVLQLVLFSSQLVFDADGMSSFDWHLFLVRFPFFLRYIVNYLVFSWWCIYVYLFADTSDWKIFKPSIVNMCVVYVQTFWSNSDHLKHSESLSLFLGRGGKTRFCQDGSEKHVLYVALVVIFVWIKSI